MSSLHRAFKARPPAKAVSFFPQIKHFRCVRNTILAGLSTEEVKRQNRGRLTIMNIIKRDDALLLFDKWKSEQTPIVFCSAHPLYLIVLTNLQVEQFSQEAVALASSGNHVGIDVSSAVLSYVEPRELPSLENYPGQLSRFTFDEGVRIDFPAMGYKFLLMSEPRAKEHQL
jgi:hypothetical protein